MGKTKKELLTEMKNKAVSERDKLKEIVDKYENNKNLFDCVNKVKDFLAEKEGVSFTDDYLYTLFQAEIDDSKNEDDKAEEILHQKNELRNLEKLIETIDSFIDVIH